MIFQMLDKDPSKRPNIVKIMQKFHIRPLPAESDGWVDEPEEPEFKIY